MTVNLEQQSLSFGVAKHLNFAIGLMLKRRLLSGLDDLTETSQSNRKFSAFEKASCSAPVDNARRPITCSEKAPD